MDQRNQRRHVRIATSTYSCIASPHRKIVIFALLQVLGSPCASDGAASHTAARRSHSTDACSQRLIIGATPPRDIEPCIHQKAKLSYPANYELLPTSSQVPIRDATVYDAGCSKGRYPMTLSVTPHLQYNTCLP